MGKCRAPVPRANARRLKKLFKAIKPEIIMGKLMLKNTTIVPSKRKKRIESAQPYMSQSDGREEQIRGNQINEQGAKRRRINTKKSNVAG